MQKTKRHCRSHSIKSQEWYRSTVFVLQDCFSFCFVIKCKVQTSPFKLMCAFLIPRSAPWTLHNEMNCVPLRPFSAPIPLASINEVVCLSVFLSLLIITLGVWCWCPPVYLFDTFGNCSKNCCQGTSSDCGCLRLGVCVCLCICVIESLVCEHCYPQVSSSELGLIGDCCLW